MKTIAHIESLYPSKFGIPRQAGLAATPARIVFEPEYRNPEALRGLDGFDYIWLIWSFSAIEEDKWQPTVRPPRLGGNKRLGVFATRSPFRPNKLGLSSVRLLGVETDSELGPTILIEGADLLNGTPIYDIKPYLPYTDSHPEARGGFADIPWESELKIEIPDSISNQIPEHLRNPLNEVLSQDPRPQYHNDPNRIYAMPFDRWEVKFKVESGTLVVLALEKSTTDA